MKKKQKQKQYTAVPHAVDHPTSNNNRHHRVRVVLKYIRFVNISRDRFGCGVYVLQSVCAALCAFIVPAASARHAPRTHLLVAGRRRNCLSAEFFVFAFLRVIASCCRTPSSCSYQRTSVHCLLLRCVSFKFLSRLNNEYELLVAPLIHHDDSPLT